MALLSELRHPNVVVFIGACVKMPNLCIVTEFVKQGALKDLLYAGPHGSTMVKLGESTRGGGGGGQVVVKLEWKQRLRMLLSAALGVNYLHTLEPVIIHRDLKSSNLLVDENWNVKVADFGFARLKEDNATMTRCGTPCWTGTHCRFSFSLFSSDGSLSFFFRV
jgi:serine/threonine protein kinase